MSVENVRLDSISLFFEENPLLKGERLEDLFTTEFGEYQPYFVSKLEEVLSPRLWNLPEVFRKKLTAYTENYQHEVNKQNRLAGIVRYNFSNGLQISAQEILRHPLQKNVPGDWLPQGKAQAQAPSLYARWPLVTQGESTFVSQALTEVEEIIQALLNQITTAQRLKQVDLYLQSRSKPGRALKIESVEFDPVQELSWRIDFSEKNGLQGEATLMSRTKNPYSFFESFAVDAKSGRIVVHPWLREISLLQEVLASLSDTRMLPTGKMPTAEFFDSREAKTILNHLRSRQIPPEMTGDVVEIDAQKSRTEIRLNEKGLFYLQHEARVPGQKDLLRRGWTSESRRYLEALSTGLPAFLKIEAREIASRVSSKRDWDMKLLKHLGILQYIFLETLSFHFAEELLDGRRVDQEHLFESLHDKIKSLLIFGTDGFFVRDLPLTELCSKSVLSCCEGFVVRILNSLNEKESFYSENGEVIVSGLVEREFRLLFEILKQMALNSGGDSFRKARTALLSKIAVDDLFRVPSRDGNESSLQGSFEVFQSMVPHGFRLFYRDQPVQELGDDEFQVDFQVQTQSDERMINWFELNPTFFLHGQEVSADQFLNLGHGGVIEHEGRLFLIPQKQLPSLKRLEKFWERLQKGQAQTNKKNRDSKVYQLPKHQTLELLALRSSGVSIRGDEEWKKLCYFYDHLGEKTRELVLPKSMTAELKPYQALGVQWLQDLDQLKLGALLADDMGLGKTLQTLAFLDDLREKEDLGQVLIVVPSSLVFNWQSEAAKFTPELPMTVFSNKDSDKIGRKLGAKEPLVVIATYGLLMEHGAFLGQYPWRVLIFDEAQNLKNISTKRTSAARALNAKFKICLTGTPMENHYGEFYSLVDLLVPGSLGPLSDFRQQFVSTEMVTREEIRELKLKIRPLLLRRTKKEILDQLPEKQETKVSLDFEDRQKEIYRDIALSYNQRVQESLVAQGEASVQLQMLTALLRLRQACSDPAALPNVKYDRVPPKLETLRESLLEIVESGESALVFTQFLQTLDHAKNLLKAAGIPVFVLHGGVPSTQRQKILADFNAVPGGAVLLMTLKTGGVGLNLTKASYVFHLEPWWNPSVENQATDRAHRLGQKKAVQVFRYIMHESLEEKIELLKDRKDRKFQTLFESNLEEGIEGSRGGAAALSKQDFDFLLGLK